MRVERILNCDSQIRQVLSHLSSVVGGYASTAQAGLAGQRPDQEEHCQGYGSRGCVKPS
jgi:hypothetical protein